jgi:hypothetical protein
MASDSTDNFAANIEMVRLPTIRKWNTLLTEQEILQKQIITERCRKFTRP